MPLPVVLYVPNLLGYARILLAFWGLHVASFNPWASFYLWILSAFLDLFDGMAARALDQTSSFGVLVDIVADNILRSCVWIATAVADPTYIVPCAAIVCVEWLTFAATQLHASAHGSHWKTCRENDPKFIQNFFSNNFRNPFGLLGIYGLFAANLLAFAGAHASMREKLPYFYFFKYLAYTGRLISMGIELWMCCGYVKVILSKDEESRIKKPRGTR